MKRMPTFSDKLGVKQLLGIVKPLESMHIYIYALTTVGDREHASIAMPVKNMLP